jgi:zinc transport system ATP-binding protein
MNHSLIVQHNTTTIFTSDEHWLYPLFALEDFLAERDLPVAELFLHDKVAGKAAACLIVRLGITRCKIELLSRRALPVFEAHGVDYSYVQLVDQIDCRTEELIDDSMDIETTYQFLKKRAGRIVDLSLHVDNLAVWFGQQQILKNLNLSLASGKQMLIHGANGTGKTTLLKTILGFIREYSGTIQIGDVLQGSKEWKKNRSLLGYIHQESIKRTIPVSAAEVVAIGLARKRPRKDEIMYRVESAMRRTGCFHLRRQPYHTLSGGEKQRVSLARCLCQKARILLFDEPTSFLDSSGKETLLELLTDLIRTERPTILLVSHELSWTERLLWPTLELREGKLW